MNKCGMCNSGAHEFCRSAGAGLVCCCRGAADPRVYALQALVFRR